MSNYISAELTGRARAREGIELLFLFISSL